MLRAVTFLVAMASRKKFWWLKLTWKSPIWQPAFSYRVPSFFQEIPVVGVYGLSTCKLKWDRNFYWISFTLSLFDNLLNLNLVLWVLSLEMSRAPPIQLRWLGSHFDSFKRSCSVAQSVPFFWSPIFHAWQPLYNFRSPKGDFEKRWAWSTV